MNMKQIEDLIRDTNARTEADIRAAVEAIEPETRLSTTEKHLANAKRRIVELERDLAVARIERDAARDAIIRVPIRTPNKAEDRRVLAANNRALAAEARAAEAEVRLEQIAKNHAIANRARIEEAARERVATAKAVANLSAQLQEALNNAADWATKWLKLQEKYDRAPLVRRKPSRPSEGGSKDGPAQFRPTSRVIGTPPTASGVDPGAIPGRRLTARAGPPMRAVRRRLPSLSLPR